MDGLFELVPLLVTIGVVAFLVGYADTLIRPLIRLLDLPTLDITIGATDISLGLDFWGVGAITVAAPIFYLIGLLISFTAGRKIMDGFSAVLAALPVVRVVFGSDEASDGFRQQHERRISAASSLLNGLVKE